MPRSVGNFLEVCKLEWLQQQVTGGAAARVWRLTSGCQQHACDGGVNLPCACMPTAGGWHAVGSAAVCSPALPLLQPAGVAAVACATPLLREEGMRGVPAECLFGWCRLRTWGQDMAPQGGAGLLQGLLLRYVDCPCAVAVAGRSWTAAAGPTGRPKQRGGCSCVSEWDGVGGQGVFGCLLPEGWLSDVANQPLLCCYSPVSHWRGTGHCLGRPGLMSCCLGCQEGHAGYT